MNTDLDILAYELLSRDDIAELRAIMDAIELADYIFNLAPDALMIYCESMLDDDDDDAIIALRDELLPLMESMILNPVD